MQQPAHDVPSHTQAPATQCCPASHAAPEPQRQIPAAQPSAVIGSHASQAAPIAPHVANETGAHTSPAQQPLAHDVASQPQRPDTHD